MVELFANSGEPDQTPHSAASDMGRHCLSITRLGSPVFKLIKLHLPLKLHLLHMKRLNKTESPIFVLLCVLCFQRQTFRFLFYVFSVSKGNLCRFYSNC